MGWFVYELAVMLGADSAAASLLAVIPLTLLTRVFAITLKMPVTVFLLSGIFPLVPGAGIYYTAYYFIQGNNALALSNGISTFKVAVALAIGITLVLSVPIQHICYKIKTHGIRSRSDDQGAVLRQLSVIDSEGRPLRRTFYPRS